MRANIYSIFRAKNLIKPVVFILDFFLFLLYLSSVVNIKCVNIIAIELI